MSFKTIFVFPGKDNATLAEVGGKGLSLIQGSKAGLPVPKGFILSVAFFLPWFQELQKTKAWKEFLQPEKYDLETSCKSLKKEARKLAFVNEQNQELSGALEQYSAEIRFAVRSSSPEEDLEGASFAGGYETVLGVTKDALKDAIKKAFASCLDYRVTVYKKENGFAITEPKIAVIIQQQIASEIAGVGFSLNPVTNNYDEAVITANWGLGETVVQGIATPDTYTVNKITGKIQNKILGKKETSIWVSENKGTETKEDSRHNIFTLNDEQIGELTNLIKEVEEYYKKPMDIEWAFAKGKLFLLQARPITAYIPLSQDTQTLPGQKKRLYFDITTVAQGMDEPISVIGVSSFQRLVKIVGGIVFGRDILKNIDTSVAWVASNGRLYANLSYLFKLFGKEKVVQTLPIMDPIAAKAVQTLDVTEYMLTAHILTLLPRGLFLQFPRIFPLIVRAKHNPEKIHEEVQNQLIAFEKEVQMLAKRDLPLSMLWDKLLESMFYHVFLRTVPLTFVSRQALGTMKKMAGNNLEKEVTLLELAIPHNVTTEMGLQLSDVALHLPKDITVETLQKRLQKNDLSMEFTLAWQTFLSKYGLRGPGEIDIASPRYRENPNLLLHLMVTMRNAPPEENTRTKFNHNAKERQKAYEAIYTHLLSKDVKKAKKFSSLYRFLEIFGGYRETHKYYLIFVVDLMRQKILHLATKLQKEGRLKQIEDIFYITLEDIDRALSNSSYDLSTLVTKNKAERKRFEHIHYPSLIDSRGFIPHPASTQGKKGEVTGTPVSPGIIKGKIKVLHTPTEKPLLKGEILVAKATDPGWTPLFVNASAVILEIGGVLQHGALVAREYGLPCVTGIEHATTLWKDGTRVEVDGFAGIVRIVEKN